MKKLLIRTMLLGVCVYISCSNDGRGQSSAFLCLHYRICLASGDDLIPKTYVYVVPTYMRQSLCTMAGGGVRGKGAGIARGTMTPGGTTTRGVPAFYRNVPARLEERLQGSSLGRTTWNYKPNTSPASGTELERLEKDRPLGEATNLGCRGVETHAIKASAESGATEIPGKTTTPGGGQAATIPTKNLKRRPSHNVAAATGRPSHRSHSHNGGELTTIETCTGKTRKAKGNR